MIRQRSVAVTTAAYLFCSLLAGLLAAAGCEKSEAVFTVDDLTEGERQYIGRVITLERARAVALTDRPVGVALLDSLAAAWGDSSLPETVAGLPDDPQRAAFVGGLLSRLLIAEQESLVLAPRPDRLAAPWPQPEVPPGPDDSDR